MKTRSVQTSFLSGVIDPRASARIETETYNQALLTGLNIVPVHLGGVRRRGGCRYVSVLPNKLDRITEATVTAPNGGSTTHANDDNFISLFTTTVAIGTTDPYVVVHYDLGTAKTIAYADVLGISVSTGTSEEFCIQYSTNDSTWTTVGSELTVVSSTLVRDYRRAATSPVSARYWRLARIGATDLTTATCTISDFNLWEESEDISEVRLIPFELTTSSQYVLAITDFSGTLFQDGVRINRFPLPYASDDIADIDACVGADSLFVVHEEYPPRYVFRDTGNSFQTGPIAFTNVPKVDFDDDDSPTPVSDVQVITFSSGWVQGHTFQIELEGARTAAITFAGDATASERSATAANIAREVQKLYTVEGFTGVTCARTGGLEYTVTLAGASAAEYELMSVSPLSAAGTATVVQSVQGTPRTEDVWSATRGYPRTVTFFEGRLFFGGTRDKPQSVFGSIVRDIVNFQILEGLDDDAIFTTMDGQQLNAINGLFSGRSLQLFTSGGEFRYIKQQGEAVTPGDAPKNQTQYGAAKIRPVSTDGATIYVQRTRKAIRDFRYDYEEDAYDSLGLSSLAGHLIDDVRDLTAWNGSSTDEINLVFVVNGDGTIALFNSRKESKVQAWTQWTTQGLFKAVAAVLEDVFVATVRTVNEVDTLFFEQIDNYYYSDCSIQITNDPASATLTGLDHLDGEECRVRSDGFVMDSATPVGGEIVLNTESEFAEVGLNFNTEITPMPLFSSTPEGPNFMRKRRIVKGRVKVRNTLGLLMNGRALSDRFYDQDSFDMAATPFTGNHSLEESSNWDEDQDLLLVFSQVDPLPLEILGIDVELESS